MKTVLVVFFLSLAGCSSNPTLLTVEARKALHSALKAQVEETLREADDWTKLLTTTPAGGVK